MDRGTNGLEHTVLLEQREALQSLTVSIGLFIIPLNSGLSDNYVKAIAIDGVGNKWIATGVGLAVYREGGVLLLYVSSSQLNFGRVYIPNSLNLKLKIRNVGTKAIGLNGLVLVVVMFLGS
jgi:ligand-binding sensor domain-containing protein